MYIPKQKRSRRRSNLLTIGHVHVSCNKCQVMTVISTVLSALRKRDNRCEHLPHISNDFNAIFSRQEGQKKRTEKYVALIMFLLILKGNMDFANMWNTFDFMFQTYTIDVQFLISGFWFLLQAKKYLSKNIVEECTVTYGLLYLCSIVTVTGLN